MIIWIISGVILIVALCFFIYFNKFNILENRVDNSLSQINVQLKRRADLIPNLVSVVKKVVKHEEGIIRAVTQARKELVSAKTTDAKVKANGKLESTLKTIFALAENYPNLKSNKNFAELQRELVATEDKVAYARQYYNDSILRYNNLYKTFPGNMFVNIYGKKFKEYLQISEAEKKSVKVEF